MRWGVSGVLVAMETGQARDRRSAPSGSYAFSGATWTPSSRLTRIRSPSQSTWLSSLAYPDDVHHSFRTWPRRLSPLAPSPSPEPQLLRLRPTSLRTQDISHLLTGVFRNLYTAEVIGEEVSASLIKARGSENARHEEFVDELQQVTRPHAPALCVHWGRRACGPRGRLCVGSRARPAERLDKCQHLLGVGHCSMPWRGSWERAKSLSDILVEGYSIHTLIQVHIRCTRKACICNIYFFFFTHIHRHTDMPRGYCMFGSRPP